jgi:hypothetical protein
MAAGVIGRPAIAMRKLVAPHCGQYTGIFLARRQSDMAHAIDH